MSQFVQEDIILAQPSRAADSLTGGARALPASWGNGWLFLAFSRNSLALFSEVM